MVIDMTPNESQSQSMAAIALMAALADGTRSDSEREKLRTLFAEIGVGDNSNVYQRVVLRIATLDDEIAKLGDDIAIRESAFEMAVAVCNADGMSSEEEKMFLDHLRIKLKLDASIGDTLFEPAQQIAGAEVIPVAVVPANQPPTSTVPQATSAELDKTILQYAITTAALELLPQSLATIGILPVQTKMVYDISKLHGFSLDKRQVLDFLGVLGIGGAGQVVEGMARKLFGGLLGSLGKSVGGKTIGGIMGGATGVATSATLTFATTYAMGQVARRYYAQNRSVSMADLKSLFTEETDKAKQLYTTYAPQIQQQASTMSLSDLPRMLKGSVM